MAYVHCHSCPWGQDDFWSKRYNPLRFFFKYELRYVLPRYIRADSELVRHTPFTLRFKLTKKTTEPHLFDDSLCMVTSHHIFSWLLLWRSVLKWNRRIRKQVWWTYASWKRAIAANGGRWPSCPACGANNLDID